MPRHPTILLLAFLVGCIAELAPVAELEIDLDRIASETHPLDAQQKAFMSGVYEVVSGADLLGPRVSGRWIDGRWCLFSQHDVVLAEMAGGFASDSVHLTGFVRVVRSGQGITVDLLIAPRDGGQDLANGREPTRLTLAGSTSSGTRLQLRRVGNLYQPQAPFHVLAHRGGGRNAERLGMSENSIAMVLHASRLGATGIEIDVKRTRDGRIIVFHDDTFSPRTVSGAYLLGRVESFDLDQIRQYGQLINGEPIPTLEDMLHAVIDSTQLSLVWIDVKDAGSMESVVRIQREALAYAAATGHPVRIAIGIVDDRSRQAYLQAVAGDPTPTISELDRSTTLASAESMRCLAWAPRWTTTITNSDVSHCHAAGVLVFTWTLDVREYIAEYLFETPVDGILSNYPSLVAGMQDTRAKP